MVLVNTPVNKINAFYDQVSECAFEYLMKYKVDISPVIKNIDHFNYWKNDLPYYYNVEQEGVVISGSAKGWQIYKSDPTSQARNNRDYS